MQHIMSYFDESCMACNTEFAQDIFEKKQKIPPKTRVGFIRKTSSTVTKMNLAYLHL